MNRRDPVKRGADTDVRRKEKENRKLHMELKSEREKLTQMMIKYQREINEMQAVSTCLQMVMGPKLLRIC